MFDPLIPQYEEHDYVIESLIDVQIDLPNNDYSPMYSDETYIRCYNWQWIEHGGE